MITRARVAFVGAWLYAAAGTAAAADLPAAYADAVAVKDFPKLLQLINTQFDIPPLALAPPEALYPVIAGRAGVQGTVKLVLYIDAGGDVRDALVADSPGWMALEEAARKSALAMRYRPARRDDQPVAAWYVVDIIFFIPAEDD